MSDKKYIIVGKLGAPHGVQGMIKVQSDTDPVDAILQYKPWYIKHHGEWQVLEVLQAKPQGTLIVAKIKNFTDREQVKVLTGKEIAVTRDQLPELDDDSYYWTDLEGMQVVNLQEIVLGTVDYLFSNGANDVMVVKGEKRYLVPFIQEQFILNVDFETHVITVDWDADF